MGYIKQIIDEVKMNNCLIIMNPREIPICIEAFKSLKIDKVWFKGYTEKELEEPINKFIRETNYDNYIIGSDDSIPTQEALEEIILWLSYYNVVTGWSRNSPKSKCANLILHNNRIGRLIFEVKVYTRYADSYIPYAGFTNVKDILKQTDLFRTYHVGFSLTGMRKELWLKYPFKTQYKIGKYVCSDTETSRRLNKDKILMICARKAYVEHLKSHANWIVGIKPKQIIFEKYTENTYIKDTTKYDS